MSMLRSSGKARERGFLLCPTLTALAKYNLALSRLSLDEQLRAEAGSAAGHSERKRLRALAMRSEGFLPASPPQVGADFLITAAALDSDAVILQPRALTVKARGQLFSSRVFYPSAPQVLAAAPNAVRLLGGAPAGPDATYEAAIAWAQSARTSGLARPRSARVAPAHRPCKANGTVVIPAPLARARLQVLAAQQNC